MRYLNEFTSKDAAPVLRGTAEAGGVVTIYDGTTVLGSVTVGSDGAWSFTTPTLLAGTHPLSVTVTDVADNVSPSINVSLTVINKV